MSLNVLAEELPWTVTPLTLCPTHCLLYLQFNVLKGAVFLSMIPVLNRFQILPKLGFLIYMIKTMCLTGSKNYVSHFKPWIRTRVGIEYRDRDELTATSIKALV